MLRPIRTRRSPLIETLEPRRLLHGDVVFHANINFQPADAPVPSGYLVDSGLKYGDRGDGILYGWNTDISTDARDRNSKLSADQKHDTLVHMQLHGSAKWEIAVPNGLYSVHVVSGDSATTDSVYRINIENSLFLSGNQSAALRWVEKTGNVTVSDGRLTISNGSGSIHNDLCFVEIDLLDPAPPAGSQVVEVSSPDSSASEANLDPGTFRFTRTGSTTDSLTVNFQISGSATPGSDYKTLPGSVVIPAGKTSVDLTVTPINDLLPEAAESVMVTLLDGGYVQGDSTDATVTIMDNDSAGGGSEKPYHGSPARLSATIQAEDFDLGPSNVAYFDETSGNQGGAYRSSNVDIQSTKDINGGFAVTHIQPHEWMKYTIDVPISGTYRIETRVASATGGLPFHISFDSLNTGGQTIPKTGGSDKWTTLVKSVKLTAGVHVMTFSADSASSNSAVGSLNYIRIYRDLRGTSSGVTFKSVAPLPFAREEGQSASFNGKYYAFGGLYANATGKFLATKRVDRYNPSSNTWTKMHDMPEAITHAAVVLVDGKAWFIGGYLGNFPGPGITHVWIYNFANDSWSAGPNLPQARGAGGGGLIGRQIHFFGGRDYNRDTDETTHWVYDLDKTSAGWQTRASLPSGRNHISGAVINGKLYAVAGAKGEQAATVDQSEVDVYDPSKNSWLRVADTPLPIAHVHQSTIVFDGKIITVGGELVHNVAADQVLMYDPSLNMWSLIGYIPGPRRALMASAVGNELIASGGYYNGKQYNNTWIAKLNM